MKDIRMKKSFIFSKLCVNVFLVSKIIQQLKKTLQLQGLHFMVMIGDHDLIFKATIDQN